MLVAELYNQTVRIEEEWRRFDLLPQLQKVSLRCHICKVWQNATHFSGNGALREESFSWLSMVSQAMHRHVVG